MQIEIRKARKEDVKGIVRVHVDSWRTTSRGILSDEVLDNATYAAREKQRDMIFQQATAQQYTYVAENTDGTIIGFIDGGPERSGKYNCDGEVYAIYLLEEYQRYKVGKRLFQALVSEFIKNDVHSVLVWVISNNSSTGFYEKFSPERVDTKFLERLHVQETAYRWRDIEKLSCLIEKG